MLQTHNIYLLFLLNNRLTCRERALLSPYFLPSLSLSGLMHVCMDVCWRDYCHVLQTLVHIKSIFVVTLRLQWWQWQSCFVPETKTLSFAIITCCLWNFTMLVTSEFETLKLLSVSLSFIYFFWYFVSQHVVSLLLLSLQLQAELWLDDCVGCVQPSALIEFIDPYFLPSRLLFFSWRCVQFYACRQANAWTIHGPSLDGFINQFWAFVVEKDHLEHVKLINYEWLLSWATRKTSRRFRVWLKMSFVKC